MRDVDYVVIARKYRPQTFSEVAGQDAIARTLTNAIRKRRVAHGFLFTGPSGVGKTTMARILAKALTCETGPTHEPCGVCEHCRMIAGSNHPDVYEIDAATHNGVDDIRQITERAGFAPTQARYRVFILDEVHMLSQSAWNALLKLLEEPPEHVYFIFATTEIEKVPATVVNRTQRFDFRSIELDAIVTRLGEVCAGEAVECDPTLLYRIARAAGGGMRDAQTLLDQVIAIAEDRITDDDLDLLLGAARGSDLEDLTGDLLAGNGDEALARLDRLLADGIAPATLLDQMVEHARALLLVQTCGAESGPVQRLGRNTNDLAEQARGASAEKLMRVCQILVASQQALRNGVEARLQLELASVRISRLGQVLDADGLLRRIERLERGLAQSPR